MTKIILSTLLAQLCGAFAGVPVFLITSGEAFEPMAIFYVLVQLFFPTLIAVCIFQWIKARIKSNSVSVLPTLLLRSLFMIGLLLVSVVCWALIEGDFSHYLTDFHGHTVIAIFIFSMIPFIHYAIERALSRPRSSG